MAARGRGVRSERADEREFAGRWGLRLSTLQSRVYRRDSGPVMSELKAWLDEPFTHRKVESHSRLG